MKNKDLKTDKPCTIQNVTCCSRCGGEVDGGRWENGWPNYGHIHLGFAAQAFGALAGAKHCAGREHFEAWEKGHKAMIKNDAQEVVFEWGAGYKYDSKDRYRLCYNCQKELLKAVGAFFGYGR